MKKIFEFFKSPLFLPVAALLLLYSYWLFLIPSKPFFSNWALKPGMLCLMIYFAITVLGKIFVDSPRLFSLLHIIAVPLSLLGFSYGVLYFSLIFEFYEIRPVFASLFGIVLISVITYKKLSRQNKEQAVFFLITLPIFALAVFNFVAYCPTIWAAEEFEGYRYYVIEEFWDYTHSDTHFYKCKILSFQCNLLEWTNYGNSGILIDEQKKEVSLIDPRGLRYTDGLNPRRYNLPGTQLGDHLYYLSEKCNNFNYNGLYQCETYTFIPYECNFDNKSCDPLPIKIESRYESDFYWDEDETKNEVRLLDSDDETLIFTYGEHPQCYAEGCEILQQ
jgi:hypothetical protein